MFIHHHAHVKPAHVVALGDAHALSGAFASDALGGEPYRAGLGLAFGLANERELLAAAGRGWVVLWNRCHISS